MAARPVENPEDQRYSLPNAFPLLLQQRKPGMRYSAPITSTAANHGGTFHEDGSLLSKSDLSFLNVSTMPLGAPLSSPLGVPAAKCSIRGLYTDTPAQSTTTGSHNLVTPMVRPRRSDPTASGSSKARVFTRTGTTTATLSAAKCSGTSQRCGECIMALIDNRASEVGVAICQLPSLAIIITQYGDSVAFAKTLSFVFSRAPAEVLVPETAVRSSLVQTLLRHFHDITFTGVQRRSFDESQGAYRLLTLMSTDDACLEINNTDRYLCLAAANALIEFVEITYNYTLLPNTVRVRYLALENYVEVSRQSARALNIIATGVGQRAPIPSQKLNGEGRISDKFKPPRKTLFRSSREIKKNTILQPLVNSIDYTVTAVGRRLLRSTVLQPLRDPASIEQRYNAVEWLCDSNEAQTVLRRSLLSLASDDMERVISNFSHVPQVNTLKAMQQNIEAVITLWQILRAAMQLLYALEGLVDRDTITNENEEREDNGHGGVLDCSSDSDSCGHKKPRVKAGNENGGQVEVQTSWSFRGYEGHHSRCPMLLRRLLHVLTVCRMDEICLEIAKYLDEGVVQVTGGGQQGRGAAVVGQQQRRPGGAVLQVRQCFAVKPNISGTLDAVRHQYSQTIEAMFTHAENLKQQHGVGSLRVSYDGIRGYHLCYDSRHERDAPDFTFLQKYSGGKHYALYHDSWATTNNDNNDLESECDQRREAPICGSSLFTTNTPGPQCGGDHLDLAKHQVRGRKVTCTTKEMLMLRRNADDTVAEILHTQDGLVCQLMEYLRKRLGKLQAVCDGIAMLDLLVAFATYSRLNGCVRPTILRYEHSLSSPTTHFVEARHPGGTFTANTVRWCDGASVLLLTGPNASGKTTLLRRMGQLFALAQSGCFVPAREAALHPCDRLIAHMLCDNLEDATSSAFAKEMRELSHICMHATRDSVVLVDELGRRTAARGGTAIAWATVEFLVEKRCRTIFTTHFSKLTCLEHRSGGAVRNVHFVVDVPEKAAGGGTDGGGPSALEEGTHDGTPVADIPSPEGGAKRAMCTLRFKYHLLPGASEVDCYGLRLAARVGFFSPALKLAWELLPHMAGSDRTLLEANACDDTTTANTVDRTASCRNSRACEGAVDEPTQENGYPVINCSRGVEGGLASDVFDRTLNGAESTFPGSFCPMTSHSAAAAGEAIDV